MVLKVGAWFTNQQWLEEAGPRFGEEHASEAFAPSKPPDSHTATRRDVQTSLRPAILTAIQDEGTLDLKLIH